MIDIRSNRLRAGLLAFLGTVAMSATLAVVAPSTAKADAPYCRDVTFIGARGTLDSASYGGTVGVIRQAYYDAFGSSRVASWSLDYPASIDYFNSMAIGRRRLLSSIKNTVRDCPNTKFVLAGYSQGAHIVGDVVMQIAANTGEANGIGINRIAGVGLVGDPMFNRSNYGSMWAGGSGTLHGAFGSRGQWPAALASRVVDACIKGDPICDSWGVATIVAIGFTTPHSYYTDSSKATLGGTSVARYVGLSLASKTAGLPRVYNLPAPASPTALVKATTQRMSAATLNSSQAGWYTAGSRITLSCYAYGQGVSGYFGGPDSLWYRTSDGYYAADIDIETGTNSVVAGVPACNSSTPAPSAKTGKVMVGTQRMSGPDLHTSQAGWYQKGTTLSLVCYVNGQGVSGYFGGPDSVWYRISDGYYAADIDLETGSNAPITAHC